GLAAGAVDGGTHPAARGRGAARRPAEGAAEVRGAAALVPRAATRARAAGVALERQEPPRVPAAVADAARSDEPRAGADARRGRLPVGLRRAVAVEVPPRPSVRAAAGGRLADDHLRAGRRPHAALRRQLELARADLDAAELHADRVAEQVPRVLR